MAAYIPKDAEAPKYDGTSTVDTDKSNKSGSTTDSDSSQSKTAVTIEDNSNGCGFNGFYKFATSAGIIKAVTTTSYGGVYVTNLSNSNPWYIKSGYGGKSNACLINNYYELIKNSGVWNSSACSVARQLKTPGTTLANCVGFVHGRVREVWELAKASGKLVKKDGKWYYGTKEIEGSFSHSIPACNAYSFNNVWRTEKGWGKGKRPKPGAIVCWRDKRTSNGQWGHVAFVEGIFNYGKKNEYCIMSESAFCYSGAQWVVRIYKLERYPSGRSEYSYSGNFELANFLYSPACQVSDTQFTDVDSTIDIGKINTASEGDKEKYKQISNALKGKKVLTTLPVYSKVEIEWFGNEKANGTGKRLNMLTCKGYILSYNSSDTYPYGVSLDGNTIAGYFERKALKSV